MGVNIKWSPENYKKADVIAREAGQEMISRLDWMTLQPRVILDVGCGTGVMGSSLQKRYPKALIIALDASETMLKAQSNMQRICADAASIPLHSESVDLIFANLLTPWVGDLGLVLKEWRRLLRPEGILLFSSFGPDTLANLPLDLCIPNRMDMHNLGDQLLAERFADPVLDVDYYTTTYQTPVTFINELCASGICLDEHKLQLKQFMHTQPPQEGVWEATYEVIYAHAFAPEATSTMDANTHTEVSIPLSSLRNQLRRRDF